MYTIVGTPESNRNFPSAFVGQSPRAIGGGMVPRAPRGASVSRPRGRPNPYAARARETLSLATPFVGFGLIVGRSLPGTFLILYRARSKSASPPYGGGAGCRPQVSRFYSDVVLPLSGASGASGGLPCRCCPGFSGVKARRLSWWSNGSRWYLADELNADLRFVGARPYR